MRGKMKRLFLQVGSWSPVLFLIGLIPQVYNNFMAGEYLSGSLSSWIILDAGYFVFATYQLVKKDLTVATLQYIGGVLCTTIILQYYLL